MLKNHQTLNWLKKRYSSRIADEYLFNESERQRFFEIFRIFQKFDTDGSGSLDVSELEHLLKKTDLKFEKDQIDEIFKIIDADGSKKITVDEF
jgi:Ca2+-binding EF-hand superfamily protein